MRTTIDIPEDVLRRCKAEAALRGMKLKDYVAEALRAALRGPSLEVREEAPEFGNPDVQRIADDCFFPVISGPAGPAMRDLTAQSVHEILEEQDVERARVDDESG